MRGYWRRRSKIANSVQVADANMMEFLAELEAEENAAQAKGSKPRRKKNKNKKGGADQAPVSSRVYGVGFG